MSPLGCIPGSSQSQEVTGIVCEQSTAFMDGKRKLEFVRRSQVFRFASGETVHAVLA